MQKNDDYLNNSVAILSPNDLRIKQHPSVLVIWNKNREEVIRFEPNGDIFIRGKLTTNDLEVVNGFKKFLKQDNYI